MDYSNKAFAIHPKYEQAEQIKMYVIQMYEKKMKKIHNTFTAIIGLYK